MINIDLIFSYIFAGLAVGVLTSVVVSANETSTIVTGAVVSALFFVYSMREMAKYVLAVKEEKTKERGGE